MNRSIVAASSPSLLPRLDHPLRVIDSLPRPRLAEEEVGSVLLETQSTSLDSKEPMRTTLLSV